MKKILLMCLVVSSATAHAQTWDEWFKQRRTQRRYLIEQIAALKVYSEFAWKGYQLARQGLGMINTIKKGDFSLHRTFFESLLLVNPNLRRYKKVASIIELQSKTVKTARRAIQIVNHSEQFSVDEIRYCNEVVAALLEDCENLIDVLLVFTTDGEVQLKDNERMAKIDALYQEAQDKFSFSMAYSDEISILARQRLYQSAEVARSRVLRDIP